MLKDQVWLCVVRVRFVSLSICLSILCPSPLTPSVALMCDRLLNKGYDLHTYMERNSILLSCVDSLIVKRIWRYIQIIFTVWENEEYLQTLYTAYYRHYRWYSFECSHQPSNWWRIRIKIIVCVYRHRVQLEHISST